MLHRITGIADNIVLISNHLQERKEEKYNEFIVNFDITA
jgi:hypothetical protein